MAIARAVANVPRLLLADEPTGNLDPHTSDHVFHALSQLVKASGLTVVLATHNMEIAARMDRRVTIRDGQIVEMASEGRRPRGHLTHDSSTQPHYADVVTADFRCLTLEQTMNYVLYPFREEIMFRAVVEEAAALASISLFPRHDRRLGPGSERALGSCGVTHRRHLRVLGECQ